MWSMRAKLYRYQWELRSLFSTFGLTHGIRLVDEIQHWPRSRIEELRDIKLRRLVAHAYEQIPYYRRMMDEHGVRSSDVRGVGDIHKLPIMTKEILREHKDELRAQDIRDEDIVIGVTGGTTGNPMRVVRDRACTVWQRACYWRGFSWGGLTMGEPWVQIFGGTMGLTQMTPRKKLANRFAGKVFLPAFELGSHNAGEYVDAVRRSKARFLVGYASACYLFATHVDRSGRSLKLQAVFPTAELLPEPWAETIERVFSAKVLPYYGCGEVQSLAYSCPVAPRPLYHTCDEHVVLEVEQTEGSASLTGEGAFLITDLDNMAMPLIRYRNGDAGVLAAAGCACGRTLGRIVRLDGRVNDVLITTRGDAISGVIGTHSFRVVQNVEHFQIVQKRPGHATIRVVRAAGYNAAVEEPKLRTIFAKNLGADADIEIEYVPLIPRTPAGKARLVINEYLEAENKRDQASTA